MKESGDSGQASLPTLSLSFPPGADGTEGEAFCRGWGSKGKAGPSPPRVVGALVAELAHLAALSVPTSPSVWESWLLFYEETEVKRSSELSEGIIEA